MTVEYLVWPRNPDEPHPWLDARVEADPGATVIARIVARCPFRCSGLSVEGPIEVSAGWSFVSFYVGLRSQLAVDEAVSVPLHQVVTTRLSIEVANPGSEIFVGLRNDGARRRGLTLRFLGEMG
jgi:hypothetical protein